MRRIMTAVVLIVLGATACRSEATPVPSASVDAPAGHFELGVGDALAYFEEHALACLGPDRPFPDSREWLCQAEFEDGAALDVRVVGDEEGVSQIVGISHGDTPENAVAHLVNMVASLVVAEPDGQDMRLWASDHAALGREWEIAGTQVDLRPHSEARAIMVTATR